MEIFSSSLAYSSFISTFSSLSEDPPSKVSDISDDDELSQHLLKDTITYFLWVSLTLMLNGSISDKKYVKSILWVYSLPSFMISTSSFELTSNETMDLLILQLNLFLFIEIFMLLCSPVQCENLSYIFCLYKLKSSKISFFFHFNKLL